MKDAQAAQDEEDDFCVDEAAPYAELWLGTHPSGMSSVSVNDSKTDLIDYVRSDPVLHGAGDEDLSFLLKILSVRKVLSIQAHPDKQLAERLHAERPSIYKDPNHKPEMAIALSETMRAMCGFRPLLEIKQHLSDYPEFRSLLGEGVAGEIEQCTPEEEKAVLRKMFHGYIEAEPHVIEAHVEQMVERLQSIDHQDEVQKLILQLEEQFPGDCGIFAPLIFNILELKRGEALFIDANEPHAYVSGEIIECMACSDNVVRAGLTPKLKDVHTLVNMLTYQSGKPTTTRGEVIDDCTMRYQPPVEDFCMETIYVPAGASYEVAAVASPSVLLTLEGDASIEQDDVATLDMGFGSATFLSASTRCRITAGPFGTRLTRAFRNVFYQA